MDIEAALLNEHSKANTLFIANHIGNDKKKFRKLMKIFSGNNLRATQGAAWVLSMCCDRNPELIIPYLNELVLNLKKEIPVAVKRNTVRILQQVDIPEELYGETVDICFNLLNDSNEPIAVKVFSMTVLFNIIQFIPELKNELRICIEDQMPYGSAGFKSRGKKILRSLNK